MRKTMPLCILFLLLQACNNTTQQNTNTEKVTDSGTATVKTATGNTETFNYTCTGCTENLKDGQEFQQVADLAAQEVKKQLEVPASFKPLQATFEVYKEEGRLAYQTNKPLENILGVTGEFSYTAKTGSGTEVSERGSFTFFLKDGQLFDLMNEIKLDSLQLDETGEANRNFNIYSATGNNLLSISLTKNKRLKVEYPAGNIKKTDYMTFSFEDGTKYEMPFTAPSTGTQGYIDVTAETIKQLGKAPVITVYISGEKPFSATVSANRRTYFMQLAALLK